MDASSPNSDFPLHHVELAEQRLSELANLAEGGIAAGLVSHEVRNLLTPAVAYVQLALKSAGLPTDARSCLERAFTATKRACEVAELVLSLRKGDRCPDAQCFLLPVIEECVNFLRVPGADAHRYEIRVSREITAAIPPDALRHVVSNLLLNASASFDRGRGTVRITAVCATESVCLRVADDGRGIPTQTLSTLRRSLDTDAPAPAGGLGLFLCRRILAMHGATIALDSREGEGTTVTLSLRIPNKVRSSLAA
jgi:signal transduction histidine kinase